MVRSASSAALNYGEARGASSDKDFVYKMRLSLKELRESHVCLKIIFAASVFNIATENEFVIKEANELVAIFVSSIKTMENKKS